MLLPQPLNRSGLNLHSQHANGCGELILVPLAGRQQMQRTLMPLELPMRMFLAVTSGKNQREITIHVAVPGQRHSFRIQSFSERESCDVAAADGASCCVRHGTRTTWHRDRFGSAHKTLYVSGSAFVCRNLRSSALFPRANIGSQKRT